MGNSQSERASESENGTMASQKLRSKAKSTKESLLHFHQTCGSNITLHNNNTVAFRGNSFNYGLTFTSRPLKESELIFVRIKETASNWSGAIRIGFTTNDPWVLDKTKLPAHSCPDFAALPGNWAKALPESLNKKDAILSFYVEPGGNVYYKLDNGTENFLMSGIDTSRKVWGVIDVYGNTMSVELVPDPEKEQLKPSHQSPNLKCNLAFHSMYGTMAVLSCNNTVARRKGLSDPYVFSSLPMCLEEKVVIRINGIDPVVNGPLEYGITTCDPSTLVPECLPKNAEDLMDWPDFWVVKRDSCNYRANDMLLFSINVGGQFVVTKNGKSVSTILYVDTSTPLWLYLKLSGSVEEIRMLGSLTASNIDELTDAFLDLNIPSCDEGELEDSDQPEEDNKSDCIICHDRPRNCILYSCGHMCMCYECSLCYWKPDSKVLCPICRQVIKDIIKVYT